MLLSYSLQVDACDILVSNIPRELQKSEMVVVYRVHNTDLEMSYEDVVGHKEVTFIMEVAAEDLVPEDISMLISVYKFHPRGAKILIGNIEFNIKIFINYAIMTMGEIVVIPGCYVLKTNEVKSISLTSTIQLMIVDESELGAGVREQYEGGSRGGSDGYSTASVVAVRSAGDGKNRVQAIYRS